MTLPTSGRAAAALLSALLIYTALPAPAFGMQGADTGVANTRVPGASVSDTSVSGTSVLEAADHAELRAEIAATGVVRIALVGDRIARAVRSAGRFEIEHEPANGDLYLRPLGAAGGGADRGVEAWTASVAAPAAGPVVPALAVWPAVLFVGTERGFTYRLTLVPVAGGPAQVLIRNPATGTPAAPLTSSADDRIGALVRLVRAVARREPLAGYAIHAGLARTPIRAGAVSGTSVSGTSVSGLTVIETWRGPRFAALVFEAGPSASEGAEGAAALARTMGGLPGVGGAGDSARLAAFWLAAPGTGPSGRLAVAVFEDTRAGDTRAGDAPAAHPGHAGDTRAGDTRAGDIP
ncbi:MAG: type-F conjugative transfer system secretin TraK [Rhodospirillaceae bacterium]|nr:type-F conjugative transfer system secretin TraK [Rhodospirillaceae bacterium]